MLTYGNVVSIYLSIDLSIYLTHTSLRIGHELLGEVQRVLLLLKASFTIKKFVVRAKYSPPDCTCSLHIIPLFFMHARAKWSNDMI